MLFVMQKDDTEHYCRRTSKPNICNIEFSSSLYDDLPSLNENPKNIVNSYHC